MLLQPNSFFLSNRVPVRPIPPDSGVSLRGRTMFYRRAAVLGLILLLVSFVSGCGKSSGGGAPTIVSLSVSTVTLGSQATTETVTGTNFTKSSVVNFNGTALTTSYTSPTQISATIP